MATAERTKPSGSFAEHLEQAPKMAVNGNVMTSLSTNAQLSYCSTDDGYVYANPDYTPLTVEFH